MKNITIKQKENSLLLKFDYTNPKEIDYWEGVYIKELFYQTVQIASRNYAYIEVAMLMKMLPLDWYINFHVIDKIAFFELKNFKDYYMCRWYGDCIILKLLAGYPIEFTKMQFTDNGERIL